jgi:multimeric flavodoxin WrbA
MQFKYIKGLSADMDDLTKEKGQEEARKFFSYVLWCVEKDHYEPLPIKKAPLTLTPATVPASDETSKGGDVVIVTDCEEDNKALSDMIDRFRAVLNKKTRVVNIREYPIKGGCLGCFNCAVSAKCIYKDGFEDLLRNEIQSAEAMVYAFSVKDHSMGSRFKMYDDRQFCNGHRTVTMGMPVGYLVNGEYSAESNLQTIIEGRCEVGGNFLCGVATNEGDTDKNIDKMAATLEYALKTKHTQPSNFLGVGGMKIFRDLIFQMQGLMKADHKFYKAHGQYDFPQKKMGRVIAMYLVGGLMASPKLKGKMGNMMNEGMLMPYKGALDKARAEKGEKVEKTDFKALIGKK